MVQWRSSTLSGMPKSESNWSPGKTRLLGAGIKGARLRRSQKSLQPLNDTYWGASKVDAKIYGHFVSELNLPIIVRIVLGWVFAIRPL